MRLRRRALAALLALLVESTGVRAHSASDAYLTVTVDPSVPGRILLHGQWDVALRDLDFVLRLDEDGDGRLTWGEVRRRQAAIAKYAYGYLRLIDDRGAPCAITAKKQMIDYHADGAYAALFFDAVCAPASRASALQYSLFFAIDPSHRGIFVLHDGASIATAVLSPDNGRIVLGL
jgi:hypothetical protein